MPFTTVCVHISLFSPSFLYFFLAQTYSLFWERQREREKKSNMYSNSQYSKSFLFSADLHLQLEPAPKENIQIYIFKMSLL